MSVKVGQIRKNSSTNYISSVGASFISNFKTIENNTTFNDFAIYGPFQANQTYYIRIPIKRIDINETMGVNTGANDNDPHNLNIDIRLYKENTQEENSVYQTIGETILIEPYFTENSQNDSQEGTNFINWCEACLVEAAAPAISSYEGAQDFYNSLKESLQNQDTVETNIRDSYKIIEFVFTPYDTFNYLAFQLRRVAYDYSGSPRIVERDTSITYDVAIINNILSQNTVNKIGVQSRPGSLIIVNREPMRIGKSGILEINNGIQITFVGMAAASNNINEFILDYTYNN